MALRQLINQSFQSPDVCFRTIRDFLAAADGIDDYTPSGPTPGPGYEIVDASYASGDPADTTAGDWCVLKSAGEAGTWPHYLLFAFGTQVHRMQAYRGWNQATHGGAGTAVGASNNIYHNGAGLGVLYIHADLDEIHIVIKPQNVSNYFWHGFGRLKPDHMLYDGTAVRVAGAIEAGEGVAITLPSWPGWARAGRKIYNWDDSGAMRELEIAAASEAARTITATQTWNMAAGSWLAEDAFLFVGNSYQPSPRAGDGCSGAPRRVGSDLAAPLDYKFLADDLFPGVDGKYGERVLEDIWVARNATYGGQEARGRLALARSSQTALTAGAQGVAWTDEAGQNWRLYTVNSSKIIGFREAY